MGEGEVVVAVVDVERSGNECEGMWTRVWVLVWVWISFVWLGFVVVRNGRGRKREGLVAFPLVAWDISSEPCSQDNSKMLDAGCG